MYNVYYDISNAKNRQKVAHYLEKYGLRIQKSYFKLDVNLELFIEIQKNLAMMINEKTDKLFFYPACNICFKKEGMKEKNKRKRYVII